MTQRESITKVQALIQEALLALLVERYGASVSGRKAREARIAIREALTVIDDALSTHKQIRAGRVAREVAMTGLEQEMF